MRPIFSIPFLFILLLTLSALGHENPTRKERWSLGGSLSFPFEYNKYRLSIFGFSFKPEASYFLLDDLEISGGTTLANVLESGFTTDARMVAPSSLFWGLQAGVHYFIPLNSTVRVYFGGDFGVLMNKWEYKQIVWFFQIPIGIAWFVHPNIAINFAVPVSFDFSSTAFFEKITVTPGYLGVRAYF